MKMWRDCVMSSREFVGIVPYFVIPSTFIVSVKRDGVPYNLASFAL